VADRPNALGYASAKRTQRTMIFPQTKPTSANEANREIIVKTMFEHEQHESWLLGRTNRRYWAGHFGQTNPRSRPRQLFRQSEPKRPISQRFSQTNLRGRLRHGCALRCTLTGAGRGLLARIPLEPILSASCAGRAPRRQVGGDPVVPIGGNSRRSPYSRSSSSAYADDPVITERRVWDALASTDAA
jgi:hypothetical protein